MNHVLLKKSVTFTKKGLKINMLITKNIVKLKIIFIIQGNIKVLRIPYVI